jgi:hypothetical protein
MALKGSLCSRMNASRDPTGDQLGSHWGWLAANSRNPLPSALMTNTLELFQRPVEYAENASREPSGDHRGALYHAAVRVSRTGVPPMASMM